MMNTNEILALSGGLLVVAIDSRGDLIEPVFSTHDVAECKRLRDLMAALTAERKGQPQRKRGDRPKATKLSLRADAAREAARIASISPYRALAVNLVAAGVDEARIIKWSKTKEWEHVPGPAITAIWGQIRDVLLEGRLKAGT